MNKEQQDVRFDNSDVLTPSSALQVMMTDRVLDELSSRGVLTSEGVKLNKEGEQRIKVPFGFKSVHIRDTYNRVLRLLTFKEAGAPHTPALREEFEVAVVTAYRNKSPHVFYIEAMYRSFFNNLTLEVDNSAVAYEKAVRDAQGGKPILFAEAHLIAFDNALRFHPLYVAYLYGVSGDNKRADIIIKEVCDYLAWLISQQSA